MSRSTTELFRLVSLRGAKAGLAFDLAPYVTASQVLSIVEEQPAALGNPELLETLLNDVTVFEADQLTRIPLRWLRTALQKGEKLALLEVKFSGEPRMPLSAVPKSPLFVENFRDIYDSWLALKLTNGPGRSFPRHENLLRAATVAIEWANGAGRLADQPIEFWLNSTILLTPRQWTTFEMARAEARDRRVAKPNMPDMSRNTTAGELRARLGTVSKTLTARRQAETAIVSAYAHWAVAAEAVASEPEEDNIADPVQGQEASRPAIRPPVGTMVTRTTGTFLEFGTVDPIAQLSGTLDRIGGLTQDKINRIKELITGPEVTASTWADAVVIAQPDEPELCREIEAIELAIQRELPPAPLPTTPDRRPLISAVGLGDLVVARERVVGYEANEIAHIENVLSGEKKTSERERKSRFETIVERQTTTETEIENEQQSTDRSEFEQEAQSSVASALSIDTGVNVSTKYGVTKIDASLEVGFQRSKSQSASQTISDLNEVISKSIERTRTTVRQLERITTIDELRDLESHEIDNTTEGTGSATAISGIYHWVEKVVELELRQYGTRLMIEFHVPEPAVSILERQQLANEQSGHRLPPFDVHPADLHRETFMCLAQRYGARLDPPPPEWVNVPYHARAERKEDDNWDSEWGASGLIRVPPEYRPYRVEAVVTTVPPPVRKYSSDGKPLPGVTVVVGGANRPVGSSGRFSQPVIQGRMSNVDYRGYKRGTAYFDPTYASHPFDQGVPITTQISGQYDNAATVQATVTAKLTDEAFEAWQIEQWTRLRQSYLARQADLDRAEEVERFQGALGGAISERPTSINRRIERTELQKWAIKAMRYETFDFHPMVTESGLQEPDPTDANAQAPVVRLFEEAFEWEQMTYYFYPYYWARRDTWHLRNAQESSDAVHEAFLRAGAARVIVPVNPGYEARVLCYLNQEDEFDGLIPGLDVGCSQDPLALDGVETTAFYDVGLDILTNRNDDLINGSGTLTATNGNSNVRINPDSLWVASAADIGRELRIHGEAYRITAAVSSEELTLDRPYEGPNDDAAGYATASLAYGPPWTLRVPTRFAVLVKEELEP